MAMTHFTIEVVDEIHPTDPKTYQTEVKKSGTLLDGLTWLQENSEGKFTFTVTEDKHYGPYLESVNGVKASKEEKTYWELLSKDAHGKETPLPVGIGSYPPKEAETIVLKFTTYKSVKNTE